LIFSDISAYLINIRYGSASVKQTQGRSGLQRRTPEKDIVNAMRNSREFKDSPVYRNLPSCLADASFSKNIPEVFHRPVQGAEHRTDGLQHPIAGVQGNPRREAGGRPHRIRASGRRDAKASGDNRACRASLSGKEMPDPYPLFIYKTHRSRFARPSPSVKRNRVIEV
jgi:hypothetical protein